MANVRPDIKPCSAEYLRRVVDFGTNLSYNLNRHTLRYSTQQKRNALRLRFKRWLKDWHPRTIVVPHPFAMRHLLVLNGVALPTFLVATLISRTPVMLRRRSSSIFLMLHTQRTRITAGCRSPSVTSKHLSFLLSRSTTLLRVTRLLSKSGQDVLAARQSTAVLRRLAWQE